jgi:hypothetical protein
LTSVHDGGAAPCAHPTSIQQRFVDDEFDCGSAMTSQGCAPEGLLHLLGRDLRPLCGCPYGLLSTLASRSTCPTCLSLWEASRDDPDSAALVVDDLELVGH